MKHATRCVHVLPFLLHYDVIECGEFSLILEVKCEGTLPVMLQMSLGDREHTLPLRSGDVSLSPLVPRLPMRGPSTDLVQRSPGFHLWAGDSSAPLLDLEPGCRI